MNSPRRATRSSSKEAPAAANNVIPLPSARRSKGEDVPAEGAQELDLVVDGRRITVVADRELVLRCGKASITLTRAGKIILRGTHVVSKSTGANRVQGSQVRIN